MDTAQCSLGSGGRAGSEGAELLSGRWALGLQYHSSLVGTFINKLHNPLSLFPPWNMNPHPTQMSQFSVWNMVGPIYMFVPLKIEAKAGHGGTGEAEANSSSLRLT